MAGAQRTLCNSGTRESSRRRCLWFVKQPRSRHDRFRRQAAMLGLHPTVRPQTRLIVGTDISSPTSRVLSCAASRATEAPPEPVFRIARRKERSDAGGKTPAASPNQQRARVIDAADPVSGSPCRDGLSSRSSGRWCSRKRGDRSSPQDRARFQFSGREKTQSAAALRVLANIALLGVEVC